MSNEDKSFNNLEFIVKYSKDDMDSWEDGTEIRFTITSPKPINMDIDNLCDLASAYLKAVGIEYREFMLRYEEKDE